MHKFTMNNGKKAAVPPSRLIHREGKKDTI